MKKIYLATNNIFKVEEVKEIADHFSINIEGYSCNIRELQTMDRMALVRHKTLEAFSITREPVLVDHASLVIECLEGMPGSLTQLFWDTLEGKICNVVNALGNDKAEAVCTVGYCDGRKVYTAEGVVKGKITIAPRGTRKFQWDSIFIPDGHKETYAEMDIVNKNKISQRRIAFEKIFKRIAAI